MTQSGVGSKDGKRDDKKPTDGPPELDQLWRDFNQSLSRLFGKNGNGSNGGSNGGDGSGADAAKLGIVVILSVAVFFWMISGFYCPRRSDRRCDNVW